MKKTHIAKGQRFGAWTVVGDEQTVTFGRCTPTAMLCECDCGTRRLIVKTALMSNRTRSCGCLGSRTTIGIRSRTHGATKTRLHTIWVTMRVRCSDTKDSNYVNYGGRGISVCEEWQSHFEAFQSWAMQNGYQEHLTIERKDNNLGYNPDNCRWATWLEQGANKRNTRLLTAFGETKHLAEWIRDPRCSVKRHALNCRLSKGWEVEKAISSPPNPEAGYVNLKVSQIKKCTKRE